MKSTINNSKKIANLERLAYECAERKYNGCNENCSNCSLNISIYLDDPREAVLIQTNAELDFQQNIQLYNEQVQQQLEYEKQENANTIAELIGKIIGIILVIVVPLIWIQSCIQGCSG